MIIEQDLEAFETNYQDAKAYHMRAEQFLSEGHRFSLIFNVGAVALERYLLAICEFHSLLPLNHTYISLMCTIESGIDFPAQLSERIKSLDWLFGICSIENYSHPSPDPEDASSVLNMCSEVSDLLLQYQSKTPSVPVKTE